VTADESSASLPRRVLLVAGLGVAAAAATAVRAAPAAASGIWDICFGRPPELCSSLYFDGYQPNRGVCPGNPGWGHAAAGFMFDLEVYSYT
jgi:hypothetical protein